MHNKSFNNLQNVCLGFLLALLVLRYYGSSSKEATSHHAHLAIQRGKYKFATVTVIS